LFGLNSFAKKFLEHDRPVAMFILGGEDEGDRLPGTAFAKSVHRRSIGFQFFAVTQDTNSTKPRRPKQGAKKLPSRVGAKPSA